MSDVHFEIELPIEETEDRVKGATLCLDIRYYDYLSEEQRKHIKNLVEWAMNEKKEKIE